MRAPLITLGLALALAPSFAHANCHDRRVAGALIGAAGGAAIGGAISHGRAGPTLLGAGLGALTGHEIARSGCHRYYRHVYYRRRPYYERGAYGADYDRARYDRYASGNGGYPACETQSQAFYDERGNLVYHPVQVCR